MKFKRDWKLIYRDLYGSLILLALVNIPTYSVVIRARNLQAFALIFLAHIACMALFVWCYYSTGALTNAIILDDDGITLQQRKQPPQKIRWDEVEKILRTRYTGGKAIVFWDDCGRKIWFYSSKRLDEYILSNHPELEPLFPAKNDVRKWEQWDKKLRF